MSKIMYIDYIKTKNNLAIVMAEIETTQENKLKLLGI
jgi:hypothetical protein